MPACYPAGRMKTSEDEESLAGLAALLTASGSKAGPALADSVGWEPRRMDAAGLFEFWRGIRMVGMCTVGPSGQPHVAVVHAQLHGPTLRVLVYEDAQRRRDLATNPRVAFVAWNEVGAVAFLYGRAREVEGSLRDARPSQAGRARRVVEFEVTLTRVHAMSAKADRAAAPPPPRPGGDR